MITQTLHYQKIGIIVKPINIIPLNKNGKFFIFRKRQYVLMPK